MIAELLFGPPQAESNGRRLREAMFGRPTSVPIGTACAIAREAIERVGRLLARELEAEIVEPIAVDRHTAATLMVESRLLRVRGQVGDAFVLVRPPDARALVAAAFGTVRRGDEALSALEERVLERLLGAVASSCGALWGPLQGVVAESATRAQAEARTYFEIRITKPCRAAIGIALTREPPPRIQPLLSPRVLNEVPLAFRVTAGRANLSVADIRRLELGSLVELNERLEGTSVMCTAEGVVVAEGVVGIEAGRYALRVAEPVNA